MEIVTKHLSACKRHVLCWVPERPWGMTLVSQSPIPTAAILLNRTQLQVLRCTRRVRFFSKLPCSCVK